MNFVREAMFGLLAPVRGVSILMSNASLRRWALLPFVVTFLVFVAGLSWGLPFVTGLVQPTTVKILSFFALKAGSTAYSVLSWSIPVLLWPPFVLFLLYILWIFTRLLASPFYAVLAERVLMASGVIENQPFKPLTWLSVSFRMTSVSLLRTLIFGAVGLLLFVVSFIPGAGIFTSICFMYIVASDFCDYGFEAMQWPLNERLRFLRTHIGFMVGFSAVLAFIFLVPGLNFFLLPASVVGATDVLRVLGKR